MEFRILGPLEVLDGDAPVDVGPRKLKLLLALLVVNAGRVVSTDRILEELWGDDADGKENALWVYVSRLRSALGERDLVVTKDHGYFLDVTPGEVDALRFESLVDTGRDAIEHDPAAAASLLQEGLDLWRGPALEEFAYEDFAVTEIRRLDALRMLAIQDRIEADLRRGLDGELIGELEALQAAHPAEERLVGFLMLALYRAGRQADALRAFERFRTGLGEDLGLQPSPDLRLLEEQILLHDDRIQSRRADGPGAMGLARDLVNPFKGLRAFTEDDASDFFGRESVVAEVVRRIAAGTPLIALVGPSGSGKSSIARAGVVPAIRKGALEGEGRWIVAQMVPGAHPFAELEAALLRSSLDTPDSLSDQLGSDNGVHRAVLRVLPEENSKLVLVIDQFEELFTLVDDESERRRFVGELLDALHDPHGRLRVIFTLRADFYDRPLAYTELGTLMGDGIVNVVPLTPDELEAAIRMPAEEACVALEPSLVASLLTDVAGQAGGLPLFQYALTELFDRRTDDTLTMASYRAMGGVRGALARRADDLFGSLDAEQRAAAQQLSLRLVTIASGDEWGRRRVPASEIVALDIDVVALQTVIDLFAKHRLLTLDRDVVTGSPTVEVAHEALLTEWAVLRGWIEAADEDVKRRDHLVAALDEWNEAGRNPDYLLGGARLASYAHWADTSAMQLTAGERAFIDASQDARDRAERDRLRQEGQTKRATRRAMGAAAAVVALLVAAGLAVFLVTRPSAPTKIAAFGPHTFSTAGTELAQSAFARAERELDVEIDYLGDQRFTDLEAEYRSLGNSGAPFVLMDAEDVLAPWLDEVVADYPDTAFVVIEPRSAPPEGVVSVEFADEQTGFLAGAAAALATKTDTIGFLGGSDVPVIQAWRAGYEAGARAVNPDVQILATHVSGDLTEGFESIGPGKAVALDLFRRGADVVLHAGGTASLGGIQAAREHSDATGSHVWVIAPDSDWSLEIADELKPYLLTSALKRLDFAVFEVIAQFLAGELLPGEQLLTVSSGSMGLAATDHLSPAELGTIADLTDQIIAATIVVPTVPTGDVLPRFVAPVATSEDASGFTGEQAIAVASALVDAYNTFDEDAYVAVVSDGYRYVTNTGVVSREAQLGFFPDIRAANHTMELTSEWSVTGDGPFIVTADFYLTASFYPPEGRRSDSTFTVGVENGELRVFEHRDAERPA